METRKKWIDILRAISMILVVFGHSVPQRAWFFHVVTPLKIPMFFAITGYVFNDCDGEIGKFLKKILFRLVIPWAILGILQAVPSWINGGITAFIERCFLLILGKALWYIPCCIIAEIIWFFALKGTKNTVCLGLLAAMLFAIGYLLGTSILNIRIVGCAMTCVLYIYFGYVFKACEEKIKSIKPFILAIIAVCYVAVTTLSFFFNDKRSMDVHILKYPHLWYSIPTIALGIFVMFSIFGRLQFDYDKIFSYIGRNTLPIYLMHESMLVIGNHLIKMVGLNNLSIWVRGPVKTVFALLVTAVLAFVFERFCPILVGKSKRKSEKLCG